MTADEVLAGLELRRVFTHSDDGDARPHDGWSEAQWRRVLGQMGATDRQVLYLWLGVGLDQGQIAAELGVTRSRAQQLTQRVIIRATRAVSRVTREPT